MAIEVPGFISTFYIQERKFCIPEFPAKVSSSQLIGSPESIPVAKEVEHTDCYRLRFFFLIYLF